jgi:hypothetical protein
MHGDLARPLARGRANGNFYILAQNGEKFHQAAVTADTDLRLTRYFKRSEGFFLRLQMSYDLRVQRRLLGDKLDFIKPRAA